MKRTKGTYAFVRVDFDPAMNTIQAPLLLLHPLSASCVALHLFSLFQHTSLTISCQAYTNTARVLWNMKKICVVWNVRHLVLVLDETAPEAQALLSVSIFIPRGTRPKRPSCFSIPFHNLLAPSRAEDMTIVSQVPSSERLTRAIISLIKNKPN